MPLDIWSASLAIVLSTFAFLVFLLINKKVEINLIEKQVEPASKEALNVLIKNFLSFGDIPTKSKLISVMTSLARKHHVQLLSHLPIQNVIDNLIYYVISNDLLDPYKKKEISDKLIKLKTDPISSEDYLQMAADNEEARIWRQKFIYSQLTKVLICSSTFIIALGVCATQFQGLSGRVSFLINWVLISTISFSLLVAAYTVLTILSHLSFSNKANAKADHLASLGPVNNQAALGNPLKNGFSLPTANKKLPLPTQKNNLRSGRIQASPQVSPGERLGERAERMEKISVDNVTSLGESSAASTSSANTSSSSQTASSSTSSSTTTSTSKKKEDKKSKSSEKSSDKKTTFESI